MALVTILAREMRLKVFSSRPSFGDVASGASHDIGARNAIEIFSKSTYATFEDVASGASTILALRLKIFRTVDQLQIWRCFRVRQTMARESD